MKKDTVLGLVALIMMLFALRSLVADEYIDCQECCKEGRFVSTECSRHCNQCDIYDDSGAAESRDFPE